MKTNYFYIPNDLYKVQSAITPWSDKENCGIALSNPKIVCKKGFFKLNMFSIVLVILENINDNRSEGFSKNDFEYLTKNKLVISITDIEYNLLRLLGTP